MVELLVNLESWSRLFNENYRLTVLNILEIKQCSLRCLVKLTMLLYVVESKCSYRLLGVLRGIFRFVLEVCRFRRTCELSRAVASIVAIGNPERHVRKASHRGSKQQ